jgi:hypothetical protein
MPRVSPRSQTNEPGYPWGAFLLEIDEQLTGTIQLQCLGGFAVTQYYGLGRDTSGIDCIAVMGSESIDFAGFGSESRDGFTDLVLTAQSFGFNKI